MLLIASGGGAYGRSDPYPPQQAPSYVRDRYDSYGSSAAGGGAYGGGGGGGGGAYGSRDPVSCRGDTLPFPIGGSGFLFL